ncbi:MAG: M56 family metallopeptidase [Longimicrobiales bacterium]
MMGSHALIAAAESWLLVASGVSAKAVVLFGLAAMVTWAMRRGSAATRHLVWSTAIAAVLVLPVVGTVLPPLALSWLPAAGRPALEGPLPVADIPTLARPDPGPSAPAAVSTLPVERAESAAALGVGTAPVGWPAALGLMWLAGALALLAHLALGHARVAALRRRAAPVTAGHCFEQLAGVAARLGVRRPMLRIAARGSMPMLIGVLRPTVLLPAEATLWSEMRLRAVLIHELAHVMRRDAWTQLAAELLCALHWPNPLAWLARRRLRIEREHACDDVVLNAGARASDYAAQLLEVAHALRAAPGTSLVAMAMARPAQLAGRLLAVLDERRARGGVRRAALAATLLIGTLVLGIVAALRPAPAAAGAATPVDAARQPAPPPAVDTATLPDRAGPAEAGPALQSAAAECDITSVSHSSSNGRHRIEWSGAGCRVRLRLGGDVRFTPELDGIASMAPGAYLEIEERDGVDRTLEVRPEADGLRYSYDVAGRQRPFDAEARRWLQLMITQLVRETGFGAAERVAQLLRQGGADAVLNEAERIRSDHVMGLYLTELIGSGQVDSGMLGRAAAVAGAGIGSDYELAQFLVATATHPRANAAVARTIITAARSIASDHEQRRTLDAVLARDDLDAELRAAAVAGADIGSDFELAQLIAAARLDLRMQSAQDLIVRAGATIDSDHELRQLLQGYARQELTAEGVAALLIAARSIDSDFELAELLLAIARRHPLQGPVREAFLATLETVGSEHEYSRVAQVVLRRSP